MFSVLNTFAVFSHFETTHSLHKYVKVNGNLFIFYEVFSFETLQYTEN